MGSYADNEAASSSVEETINALSDLLKYFSIYSDNKLSVSIMFRSIFHKWSSIYLLKNELN